MQMHVMPTNNNLDDKTLSDTLKQSITTFCTEREKANICWEPEHNREHSLSPLRSIRMTGLEFLSKAEFNFSLAFNTGLTEYNY